MSGSTGQELRSARMKMGRSVAQVAITTHLKPAIVEAMEQDNHQRLIAPTYARGFYKIYCEFLNLDPEPFIETYLAAVKGGKKAVRHGKSGFFGRFFGKEGGDSEPSPLHPSNVEPPPTHSDPVPIGTGSASEEEISAEEYTPPVFDFHRDTEEHAPEEESLPEDQQTITEEIPAESEESAPVSEEVPAPLMSVTPQEDIPEDQVQVFDPNPAAPADDDAGSPIPPPSPTPLMGRPGSRRTAPKSPYEIAQEMAQRAAQQRAALERQLLESQRAEERARQEAEKAARMEAEQKAKEAEQNRRRIEKQLRMREEAERKARLEAEEKLSQIEQERQQLAAELEQRKAEAEAERQRIQQLWEQEAAERSEAERQAQARTKAEADARAKAESEAEAAEKRCTALEQELRALEAQQKSEAEAARNTCRRHLLPAHEGPRGVGDRRGAHRHTQRRARDKGGAEAQGKNRRKSQINAK